MVRKWVPLLPRSKTVAQSSTLKGLPFNALDVLGSKADHSERRRFDLRP